jgi:hypothetical protein
MGYYRLPGVTRNAFLNFEFLIFDWAKRTDRWQQSFSFVILIPVSFDTLRDIFGTILVKF